MTRTYSRSEAEKALKFWKQKLNESVQNETCSEDEVMSAEEFFADSDEEVEENDCLESAIDSLPDDEDASGQDQETEYPPNTVGAVIELLKLADPNDPLKIRLSPKNNECMLIGFATLISGGKKTSYLDIAVGSPSAK